MKEKEARQFVLCFLLDEENRAILLGRKTQKIGKGCWNGPGGKINPGELEREAVIREVYQEIGVNVLGSDLDKVAILVISDEGYEEPLEVHVFLSRKWEGCPWESSELIDLKWLHLGNLPFDKMMPADKHWIPLIFLDRRIIAKFAHDLSQNLVGGVKIKVVDELPEQ